MPEGFRLMEALQAAFKEYGPEDERAFNLPWYACQEEPWRTIADRAQVRAR